MIEPKTISVSLQEFPGLEEGLEGKGTIMWRVHSVGDGTAEIVLTEMKMEGGNIADKAMRQMMGDRTSGKEKVEDEETDDIA